MAGMSVAWMAVTLDRVMVLMRAALLAVERVVMSDDRVVDSMADRSVAR
jgi:hypothetical protein